MKKKCKSFITAILIIVSLNGLAQKALSFDGTNDVVDFGNSAVFNITDTLTLELKVKQSVVQNYPTFAGNFQDSLNYWKGYWMGGNNGGYAAWFIGDVTATSSGYYIYSFANIADGNWHHLSGVVFGDSAKLYVDGVFDNSALITNKHLFSTQNFMAGNDVSNDLFQGSIDDIRLWNKARSSSEILLYKDSCLKGNEPGLVALYHFEKGVGASTVYDLTSQNNNGTLTNMDTINAWVAGINCTACKVYPTDTTVNQVGLNLTSNQSSATYTWLDCNNSYSVIAGAINQSYSVTTNGSYAVRINHNNCIDTSNCINVMNVGITENTFRTPIKIYPNPTNGIIHFDLSNQYPSVTISIFDFTGKKISEDQYSNINRIVKEIKGSRGLYFIEIKTGDQKATIHLMKD